MNVYISKLYENIFFDHNIKRYDGVSFKANEFL